MLKNKLTKEKLQEGFTIIEVMIVLAIAGLILVVVLVAIPQLQRNQRNQARQSTMARITTEISSYAGNNNGRVPTTNDQLDDVYERYLGCGSTADAQDASTLGSCNINVEDPSTGDPMTMSLTTGVADVPTSPAVGTLGVIEYQLSSECDGESIDSLGASGRNFAMWTRLEGGAIYCLDNL